MLKNFNVITIQTIYLKKRDDGYIDKWISYQSMAKTIQYYEGKLVCNILGIIIIIF